VRADLKEYGGTTNEFWANYGRRQLIALGTEAHKAKELAPELAQYMDSNYQPDSVVVEDAFGMLEELKKAGFKLGVVSNRDKPFFEEIDNLKIRQYFDLLLAAGEVESYKPDPGIFSAALERVGAQADSSMYVGDNYFADVIGARNAGLRPVLYDPRGIYPLAECDVIQALGQLPKLLK
jgi:HAD superfamily hydrolase (TIGR01549 family)